MGEEEDFDDTKNPYSTCGGCSLASLISIVLIFLFTSAFGGVGAPHESGKVATMGLEWLR